MIEDTSQYGDGKFIMDHFAGRIGRFLDIGAYDGIALSTTNGLYQMGWSGVCVEPSPLPFGGLVRNYENSQNIVLVNALIRTSDDAPLVKFWSTGDCLSTTKIEHRWKFADYPFTPILVPRGVTWGELLAAVEDDGHPPFSFVSVDTEGTNAAVLAAMPIRPEMVCVELDPSDGDAANKTLDEMGYRITRIGGNLIGVRP